MSLTVHDCARHIIHRLGGPLDEAALSAIEVINDAGEYLTNMHPWKWLERPNAGLDLIAGQNYVDLPDDFRELIGYDATNSLVNSLELTTHQHLLELRTNQIEVGSFNFWGVIEYEGQTGPDRPDPPRIAIWPTPAASDLNGLTISYRAGWTPVTNDQDYIRIPDFMRHFFKRLVRVFAVAYEEEDEAGFDVRLQQLRDGHEFMDLTYHDGMVQVDYGPMRGGAVESFPRGTNRFLRTTVSGPS